MDNSSYIEQAVNLLQKSQNILLITHKKIDGDGLASIIAFYLILKKLNKNVTAICEDPVPEVFKFLPTTNVLHTSLSSLKDFVVTIHCKDSEIDNLRYTIEDDKINIFISPKKGDISAQNITFKKGVHKHDLVVVLDSPDYNSLGAVYEKNVDLFFNVPVINIDHHVNNSYFAKMNIVDITASSTSEILFHMIPLLAKEKLMDENIATLLLAGIITDTGSFQNPNTTPQAFASAAKLVQYGARQQEIIKSIYKTKQLTTLRLWGQVLSNVKNDPICRLVWSTLSYKDVSANSATEEDCVSIIETLLSNAPGAEIVILLIEMEPRQVKGFVKTITPTIDAGKISSLFQGKGSFSEGTFHCEGSVSDAEKIVLKQIGDFQSKRLGISSTQLPASSLPPSHSEEQDSQQIPTISSGTLEQSIATSLKEQLGTKPAEEDIENEA